MRKFPSSLLVLLVIVGEDLCGQAFDVRDAAHDAVLVAFLGDLADRAARQTGDLEVAAFIVRDGQGQLTCELWPPSAAPRSGHYRGDIPNGTIAIAHTHPYSAPEPSAVDVEQARRIGLPIYVVSRFELQAVDPTSGERVRLLRGRDWNALQERRGCTAIAPLR